MEHNEQPTGSESMNHTGAPAPAANAGGDDVAKNKTFAIVGYILPFLFFIPLLNDESKHSPFARFHANQQLILLIAIFALYLVADMIFYRFLWQMYFTIMPIINLAILVFAILGIVNAASGKMKELPLIGQIKLLS